MNPVPRTGDWMQTHAGIQFWPLDPRPEEINIEDIAHALSHQCRYAGHTRGFYSVAEHCVLMSEAAPAEFKRAALLHDASEAYLVDIPRPIKKFLSNYTEIESRLMQAIAERFNFPWPLPSEVKHLDNRILMTEQKALMAPPPDDWGYPEEPLNVRILCAQPAVARNWFLDQWRNVEFL